MSLFDDAEVALRSARMMLAAGDLRGSGNRAYYAVFYAARAVLETIDEIDAFAIKTHDGLRRMFEFHIVRTGRVPQEIARLFNDVQQTRWSADYTADFPREDEIERSISKAEAFVSACRPLAAGEP